MAANEAAEVARRCQEATVSKELLLGQCGLRKFPDAIFFMLKSINVAKVDLSHNQLVRIPAKFGLIFSSVAGNFWNNSIIINTQTKISKVLGTIM